MWRTLESVIEDSLGLIETGRIFIGDVKDYRLIEEFHLTLTEHQMARRGKVVTAVRNFGTRWRPP